MNTPCNYTKKVVASLLKRVPLALSMLSAGSLLTSPDAASQEWVQAFTLQGYCGGIASSADGTWVGAGGNGFYVSTNSGQLWHLNSTNSTSDLVSSFDGTVLAGLAAFGVSISTNSGASWGPPIGYGASSVAVTALGKILYRTELGGGYGGISGCQRTQARHGGLPPHRRQIGMKWHAPQAGPM